ncbi:hypothetical protein N0B16_05710 [Chryseobacterium sp. GMJ5]|uniref:Uncharacterized protein n=1 Tax=Chryseobacterium gilvum TaxID=2976534 RepID=A0ABT2VVA4_9FLAO|nr:hypothetical protein [Chryseobacterium gilvum]MCU7613927.1 hypothetical protein [Chryseobacterium gilvum]
MKRIQNLLILLFFIHIAISVFININSFTYLKLNHRDKNLNSMGKFYIDRLQKINPPYPVKVYANYSGTIRGYAYYSPNIRNIKHVYEFYNGTQKINGLMKTYESDLKFNTMLINLTDIISNKSIREEIAKSLYNNVTYDTDIKELNIKLKVKKFTSLKEYQSVGRRDTVKVFEAYKIVSHE